MAKRLFFITLALHLSTATCDAGKALPFSLRHDGFFRLEHEGPIYNEMTGYLSHDPERSPFNNILSACVGILAFQQWMGIPGALGFGVYATIATCTRFSQRDHFLLAEPIFGLNNGECIPSKIRNAEVLVAKDGAGLAAVKKIYRWITAGEVRFANSIRVIKDPHLLLKGKLVWPKDSTIPEIHVQGVEVSEGLDGETYSLSELEGLDA